MSQTNQVQKFFESFNARFLSPHDVARRFVPSDNFEKLAKASHSLIVGPRGSGKTTMLKMLLGEALEAWQHKDADSYRAQINFTGVFVPTDVNWSKQIESLGKNFSDKHKDLLARAAFSIHVLHKLVSAIIYRTYPSEDLSLFPHRRLKLTEKTESLFVQDVSVAWHVEPSINSLLSLKHALLKKLSEIAEIVSAEESRGDQERDARLADIPFLHLDFLKSSIYAIEIFEDLSKDIGGRWAFLFDELELAPNCILQELINATRSTDERILFKLSLVPFNPQIDFISDFCSGMPGHDFEYIPLWYANKADGLPFCEELLKSMLSENGYPDDTPIKIFGPSLFNINEENISDQFYDSAYHSGSKHAQLIQSMSKKDISFKNYLDRKKINPEKLDNIESRQRASDLRKIISVLVVREAYRRPDNIRTQSGQKGQGRSRKNPPIYAGLNSLFTLVEGNPRWFIGIIGSLLKQYEKTRKPISPALQMATVSKTIHRFMALLRTIPCPIDTVSGKKPKDVSEVIDIIGQYFYKSVVIDKFQPEPKGSFTVDKGISKELLSSLGLALNAGAIVYVPGNTAEIAINSLEGRRFRISYLLSPFYHIPITLMRSVSLTEILHKASVSRQFSLFGK